MVSKFSIPFKVIRLTWRRYAAEAGRERERNAAKVSSRAVQRAKESAVSAVRALKEKHELMREATKAELTRGWEYVHGEMEKLGYKAREAALSHRVALDEARNEARLAMEAMSRGERESAAAAAAAATAVAARATAATATATASVAGWS